MFATFARPLTLLVDAATAIPAAARVAADVEAHRAPARSDLERLGIDPAAFAQVNLG